jgi:HAD superfamily hydrolase (TIGR01509 family)
MNDIKVVAFDCDGVLFNTEKANKAYYNQILKHFGKPPMTPEQFAYAHMHTADESLAYLFDDAESLAAAQSYRKGMQYLEFIKYMIIEPYLKPLLDRLRPKYKTAIATNRSDTMDSVLSEHQLEGYFDLVVSVLEVAHPKPHPDPLLKILEYFKIKPHQAIYVGDSSVDEQAAKSAGIPLIAYQNRSLSADFHIESLKEIEAILEGDGK